jgi:hypothetical protein
VTGLLLNRSLAAIINSNLTNRSPLVTHCMILRQKLFATDVIELARVPSPQSSVRRPDSIAPRRYGRYGYRNVDASAPVRSQEPRNWKFRTARSLWKGSRQVGRGMRSSSVDALAAGETSEAASSFGGYED